MHLSPLWCIWGEVHTLMQWYIQLNHKRSKRTKKWNKCIANDRWPIKIHWSNRLDQWHAYYSVHSKKKCKQLCIWCEVHILMQWYSSNTRGVKGLKIGIDVLLMTSGQSKSIKTKSLTNDMHGMVFIPKRNVANSRISLPWNKYNYSL